MTTGTGFHMQSLLPQLEAVSIHGHKVEEEKGTVSLGYTFTPRLPHPQNMGYYDKWSKDAEARVALNVLTDIAVPGFYTKMAEGIEEDHANKEKIDKYGEDINLDEKLSEIQWNSFAKGFCPTQIVQSDVSEYDLHLLPPETFYIWRTIEGDIIRYTQERSYGDIIRSWEPKEGKKWQERLKVHEDFYTKNSESEKAYKEAIAMESPNGEANDIDEIKLFFHRQTRSDNYGVSLLEPIGKLLDGRNQLNTDMIAGIHRWANPIPIMTTSRDKAALAKALEEREVDQWVLIGNVNKDEVNFQTLVVEPAARFVPYVEMIYYQICEGLHAPLLLYLKNATEASATVMMESVDRLINGVQRYLKRRVERYLFKPQVSEPVPRLIWGQARTILDTITLTDIAQLQSSRGIKFNQVQDLLKQKGINLPKPEEEDWEKQLAKQPFQQPFGQNGQNKPFQKAEVEVMIEKLNDLDLNLNLVQTLFVEKKITVTEAFRMGDRAITVYMKRVHGEEWMQPREDKFREWIHRIMPALKVENQ